MFFDEIEILSVRLPGYHYYVEGCYLFVCGVMRGFFLLILSSGGSISWQGLQLHYLPQ
jgi:hypothetical protein